MSLKKERKPFLYTYLFTWVISFVLFWILGANAKVTFLDILSNYIAIVTSYRGLITLHSFFLVVYLIFLLVRYFVRVYRKYGVHTLLKRLVLRLLIPFFVVFYGIKLILFYNAYENFEYAWNQQVENLTDSVQNLYELDGKHRGMTVYDFGRRNSTRTLELIQNNVEWVVVLPYFYQESETTNSIQTNQKTGIWTHRDSMFIQSIEELHQKKLKVHLKPHLWMSSGWRSNIHFDNLNDWNLWFESYRNRILHYANLAEKTNTELLCIGTELRSSIQQQPEKWKQLIQEIRLLYSGKLTYAANWDDDLESIEFWSDLDYIGIQAYFPLTENTNPTLEQVQQGWQQHKQQLEHLSQQFQKKILFTEVGYRPVLSATKSPWTWGSFFTPLLEKKSDKTQYVAFEVLFEELWKEPWFAGTYIWQWNNSDFEIKGKPAQNSVAKWYSKQKAHP